MLATRADGRLRQFAMRHASRCMGAPVVPGQSGRTIDPYRTPLCQLGPHPRQGIAMTFIGICILVVGFVWGGILALRGSILVACGLFLVSAAVCGHNFYQFDLAGITWTIDRLALLWIVFAAAIGWKVNRIVRRKWTLPEYLLGLFMVVLTCNLLLHDWRRVAADQEPIPQHFIEGYAIPCLLYALALCHRPTEKQLQMLYALFAVFGVYLAWTACCEVAGAWSFVFPRYIADPDLGIHFGRARGPFVQSVRLGIYLTVALAATWIPLVWRREWGRPGILLGLCVSGLLILGMLLTYTRSIWLGLGVGIVLVMALTFRPPWRRVSLYALFVSVLFALPLKDALMGFQREYGSQETLESTRMRAVFAYVSYLMIQDRPLCGFGFGHFPHEKKPYLNDRSTTLRLESIRGYIHHNTYLSILVELGIVGFLPYVLLLAAWARRAWRQFHASTLPPWIRGHALVTLVILGTCSIQMIFHEVSYSVFENGILFFFCGVSGALAAESATAGTRPAPDRRAKAAWSPGTCLPRPAH